LKETFANLRLAGLKLNSDKCVFKVSKGKMLGYIIAQKAFEPTQIKPKQSCQW
jgi:hypothetical protein